MLENISYSEMLKETSKLLSGNVSIHEIDPNLLNATVKSGKQIGVSMAMVLARTAIGLDKLAEDNYYLAKLISKKTLNTTSENANSEANSIALILANSEQGRAILAAQQSTVTTASNIIDFIYDLFKLAIIYVSVLVAKIATRNNDDLIETCINSIDNKNFNKLWESKLVRINATAQDNLALISTCLCNQVYMFHKLWEIDDVRANATARDNQALIMACGSNTRDKDNHEICLKLLERADVRAKAAIQNNQALINVCINNKTKVFDELWQIPEVRAAAAVGNNEALFMACSNENLYIVNKLLQQTSVWDNASAQNNRGINLAIINNNLALFNLFLANPNVLAHIADNNNEVLQYARDNNRHLMVEKLLKIKSVLILAVKPKSIIYSNINTHNESIHKSVSQSAINLSRAYNKMKFTEQMYNLDLYLNIEKNMYDIIASIKKLRSEDTKHLTIDMQEDIKLTIKNSLDYVKNSQDVEPVSKITLSRLLQLLLIGMNQLDNEIKTNAHLQLCAQLYLLQTEYNQNNNTKSCPSGFFNALVYSQQSTLSNEIDVKIQVLTNASNALQDKMRTFATTVLNDCDFLNVDAFENYIVKQTTKDECVKIIQSIVEDYHMVFDYKIEQKQSAQFDQEIIDKACVKLGVQNVELLFQQLPIDYAAIYDQHKSKDKRSTLTL